jgi:uncharacterized protein (DUF2249 family)
MRFEQHQFSELRLAAGAKAVGCAELGDRNLGDRFAMGSKASPVLERISAKVDLHQGQRGPSMSMVKAVKATDASPNMLMPPLTKFKRFDVRPLLEKGREPLPEILKRVASLKHGEGLIVVAPFLPSPLIEKLGSEGFESKIERVQGGQWVVYFWRTVENESVP